jgi:hypothetical protein
MRSESDAGYSESTEAMGEGTEDTEDEYVVEEGDDADVDEREAR